MARNKGNLPFSGSFEVQAAQPFDARMNVALKEDLINPVTWTALDGSDYVYPGMITVVSGDTEENNGLYRLKQKPITEIDNWQKIGGNSGGATDYTTLENKPAINGVALNGNKTTEELGIIIPDVSGYALKTELPTNTSDLTNDSDFVVDANYVHTDYNFTQSAVSQLLECTLFKNSYTPIVDTLVSDTDALSSSKADKENTYTKTESDEKYQEELISGTNIKTINNQSILGEGNIVIEGGVAENAVLYTEQTLTAEQQAQARDNINSASQAEYEKLWLNPASAIRINAGENTLTPSSLPASDGSLNSAKVDILADIDSPVKDYVGYIRQFSSPDDRTSNASFYNVTQVQLGNNTYKTLSVSYWVKDSEFLALTEGDTTTEVWIGVNRHFIKYTQLLNGEVLNTVASAVSTGAVFNSKCEHKVIAKENGWSRIQHSFTEIEQNPANTETTKTPVYFVWTSSWTNIKAGMMWTITDLTILLDQVVIDDFVYPDAGTLIGNLITLPGLDSQVKTLNIEKINEAPIDGKQYTRKDGKWVISTGGSGSADAVLYTEQTLTEQEQKQARLNIGAANIELDSLLEEATVRENRGENTDTPAIFSTRAPGANAPGIRLIEDTESPVKDYVGTVRQFYSDRAPTSSYYVNSTTNLAPYDFTSLSWSYWIKEDEYLALVAGNKVTEIYFGIGSIHKFYYEDLINTGEPQVTEVLNGTGVIKNSTCTHSIVARENGWARVQHYFTNIEFSDTITPETTLLLYYTWNSARVNITETSVWSMTDLTILKNQEVKEKLVYPDTGTIEGNIVSFPKLVANIEQNSADIDTLKNSIIEAGELNIVQDVNNYLYVGRKWDDEYSIVHRLRLDRGLQYSSVANTWMANTYLARPHDITDDITSIKSESDDDAPSVIYGYIGANHGWNMMRTVHTTSAHGKTLADVGSTYTQGGKTFTLMRVVDEDTLWVISITDDFVATSPIAGDMIYVGSGENTSNISVATVEAIGSLPGSSTLTSVVIYADDKEIPQIPSSVSCDNFKISETYLISDLPAVVKRITADRPTGGYTEDVFFNSDYTEALGEFTNIREYDRCGSCTITQTYTSLSDVERPLSQFNVIQGHPITGIAGTNEAYVMIPKTKTSPTGQTLDVNFSNPVNWTEKPAKSVVIKKGDGWANDSDAPDRMLSFNNDYGFTLGYVTNYASQKDRADVATQAMWLYTSRKMYPHAVYETALNNNESLTARGYRIYTNRASLDEGMYSNYLVKSDTDYFLYLDFGMAKTFEITMPEYLIGRSIEIYESKNATFSYEQVSKQMHVVSTATPEDSGYLVLKMTKNEEHDIKYTKQSLTEEQKIQARTNIGASDNTQLENKQDVLVSGTNIKTINGNSILGSGDIAIEGSDIEVIYLDMDLIDELDNESTPAEVEAAFVNVGGYAEFRNKCLNENLQIFVRVLNPSSYKYETQLINIASDDRSLQFSYTHSLNSMGSLHGYMVVKRIDDVGEGLFCNSTQIEIKESEGLSDAPVDGKQYSRQDANWSEITSPKIKINGSEYSTDAEGNITLPVVDIVATTAEGVQIAYKMVAVDG